MAAFKEHCNDCARLLGDHCRDVNGWMDELHKRLGPLHRFVRHHARGAQEAGRRFGDLGRRAALVHILKDCGHIPTTSDWAEQKVDSLGIDPKSRFNGYWDPVKFDQAARRLLYETCQVPPPGWICTRVAGHDGPCAAIPS